MRISIGQCSIVLALTASACIPSLKSAFVEASYPKKVPPLPDRNLTISVDAAVVPALVVLFEEPPAAGASGSTMAGSAAGRKAGGD
jgi:hypothetical protein